MQPMQYREEVEAQIEDMLDKGIIEETEQQPLDGSCSVSHKENRRSTNMCGLQGIKQISGEGCMIAYRDAQYSLHSVVEIVCQKWPDKWPVNT